MEFNAVLFLCFRDSIAHVTDSDTTTHKPPGRRKLLKSISYKYSLNQISTFRLNFKALIKSQLNLWMEHYFQKK